MESKKKRAEQLIQSLLARGEEITPIVCTKKKEIASSFWGQKWCHYVHHFDEMAHRLSQGRSLLRNSCVLHLEVDASHVRGKVFDQEIYHVEIRYEKIPKEELEELKNTLRLSVTNQLSLLSGDLSQDVMTKLCENPYFFPALKDVRFSCNCLDYADFCGHAAALCYGLGLLFDQDPTLLFKLRQIQVSEIFSGPESFAQPEIGDCEKLSSLFQIDLV